MAAAFAELDTPPSLRAPRVPSGPCEPVVTAAGAASASMAAQGVRGDIDKGTPRLFAPARDGELVSSHSYIFNFIEASGSRRAKGSVSIQDPECCEVH